ncbi:glycoside hydrolase family 31 protein [Parapedobacter indicus]|uniref:Alpha-D-xyloside xylohydrolase n=1 Tax=Parapedobacter indicus TaxID=1477437 RepID=A0A1I3F565_9SPHI|nr:TIM-barrel domain-containing protein [Parapedobacter indicus]PPL03567.1 alpha-D-xyloside xylohydrolase [Parapedobacter indicus]SFI06332.1 alpha-D-xyloside xylohydrolase [Parapedobacter indicus]
MIKRTLISFLIVFHTYPGYCRREPSIATNIPWQQVAPGVWKGIVGTPDQISPLSVAEIKPRIEALTSLGNLPFPAQLNEGVAEVHNHLTSLRFPLRRGEEIYGLGLQFKSVKQRGTIKQLRVDHYGGTDNGRTHAPVPFYVTDNGYGVLINTARYLTVYAGTGVRKDSNDPPPEMNRNSQRDWNPQPYSDAVEIAIPASGTEIYVFAGKNMMEVVQRYNLYCGGGILPPKWGLGFTHRTPTLYSDQEVMNEVEQFNAKGYPLSFVGLEPGWQSRSYPNTFVWDSTRFPRPNYFVNELLKRHIRVNLWINPYVSSYSPIYKKITPYTGSHTVWVGEVPDFFMPQARKLYKQLFTTQHLDIGVSGFKVDEVDGYDNWLWPDVAKFPSETSAEQMRQVYGLQFQKMTADWFREKNQRTYGLVRASNAGAASLPYVLYNDYYNHRDFITALCNSSFIGVLWTPEARSSKTAEEWLRRMQAVCFSPMAMLNAWADGTKPWSFPEVEKQVKDVMLLRMQLLPYLYTTFAQYHLEGKPPVRAMPLVEGFNYSANAEKTQLHSSDNPYTTTVVPEVKDQFMLGDYLLVAPLFAGDTTRKVVLPKGKWYDFYTGDYVGDGEIIEVPTTLNYTPLFVRDGGIIPMMPPMLHVPENGEKVGLTVRHYGKAENSTYLYDDDGTTFNYENGTYSLFKLSVTHEGGKLKGSQSTVKADYPSGYRDFSWKFMTK